MHSNGRLWTTAIIALILGVVAGGAAMSLSERARLSKLQESLTSVMQRLEDADRQVQDLSDKLNQTPAPAQSASQSAPAPETQPQRKRQFAFIKSLTPGSPGRLVADYAAYLTGEEAAKAATKAGEESPPPNDYFISNESERTTALKVDSSVTVKLTTRPGEGSVVGGYETDAATLAGYLSANSEETVPLRADGYWLTVVNGVVIEIEEQYAP